MSRKPAKAAPADGPETFMRELIRSGELLAFAAFEHKACWTSEELTAALASNRVFSIDLAGEQFIPAFFPDGRYDRKQLEAVGEELRGLPGGGQLQFWRSGKGSLGGLTPLEALERGQVEKVLATAAAFADRRPCGNLVEP